MERLKNTESKNEEQLNNQLKLVKNGSAYNESLSELKFFKKKGQDAKEKYNEIKEINNEIDYSKLVGVHTNGKIYDFTIFRRPANLTRSIYYGDILIEQAKSR